MQVPHSASSPPVELCHVYSFSLYYNLDSIYTFLDCDSNLIFNLAEEFLWNPLVMKRRILTGDFPLL